MVLMAAIPVSAQVLDDLYEENDILSQAWHPGYDWEGLWLTSIGGMGIESDDDWYEIDVSAGEKRVRVEVQFTNSLGDIDVQLFNSSGTELAISDSFIDSSEYIEHIVPVSGTYYIRVYSEFTPTNNEYNLRWNALPSVDDIYEENDLLEDAWYPGYNWEGTLLSTIGGMGVQSDDDWYEIDVSAGEERLLMDACFTDADGDIDLALYDSGGSFVAGSLSYDDNEFIDHTVAGPGKYYIWVGGIDDFGNPYDLWWGGFPAGASPNQIFDLNSDGRVDIVDIMLVASRWNTKQCGTNYDHQFDLDGDGDIDVVDIMMVAAQWGWTE
jgi:hypothetical protein